MTKKKFNWFDFLGVFNVLFGCIVILLGFLYFDDVIISIMGLFIYINGHNILETEMIKELRRLLKDEKR